MSKVLATTTSETLVARIERAAAMVYLDGATETQISKALGIKGVTLRDWKKRSEWSGAVEKLRAHQESLALERLSFLTEKAATAVEDCLGSPNETVKLKAATWVLERAIPPPDGRNRATGGDRPAEIEKFLQLVAINVHK